MINSELRISEGEQFVGRFYRVLDLGHVGLVSYHGTDALVEAAARCSYKKGTRKTNDTKNLIRYLIRHNHSSPVEQANITFSLKAPLFVIQQILRHRTARLNQESFRYSEVNHEVYSLASDEWRLQDVVNKQGSSEILDESDGFILSYCQNEIQGIVKNHYEKCIDKGIAKEIARKDISVSTYSTLYWQMDLRNLLHFLKLRTDSHAQKEIRDYAHVIGCLTKKLFPICFNAWYDYSYGATTFSRLDRLMLKFLTVSGSTILNKDVYKDYGITYHKEIGMSDREFEEFWGKIDFSKFEESDFDISKCIEINSNATEEG